MDSRIAHVEPLPLVPPTVITGAEVSISRRSMTSLMRSKVRSIDEGWMDSIYPSQSLRFIGCLSKDLEDVKLIFR